MSKKIYVIFLSLTNFINIFSMGIGGGSSTQGNYGSGTMGGGGTTGGAQGSKGGIFGSGATGAELSSKNLFDQSSVYDTKGGKLETKQEENEGKVMVGAAAGYLGHRHSKNKAAKEMEGMKSSHEKEMENKEKELGKERARTKRAENRLSERESEKYTKKGKSKRSFEEEEEELE